MVNSATLAFESRILSPLLADRRAAGQMRLSSDCYAMAVCSTLRLRDEEYIMNMIRRPIGKLPPCIIET